MRTLITLLLFITGGPLWAQLHECGTDYTDQRNGQVYPTVQIGQQCWMARNMNIGTPVFDHAQSDNAEIEKTCYRNLPLNCKVYGGLYTWDEAMQYSRIDGSTGICPDGWHIPSVEDWRELTAFLGEDTAGMKMKVTSEGYPSWDGTNSSGFSALPAGGGYAGSYHRINSWALFWSSTENGNDRAWFTQLDNYWYVAPPKYLSLIIDNYYQKFNGMSVRCIRNR